MRAIADISKSAIVELGDKQAVCPKHGEFVSRGRKLLGREIWAPCPACEAERLQAEKAEAQAEAKARRIRALEQALQQAAVPARFLGKTIDSYDASTAEQQYAKQVAQSYVEAIELRIKQGQGLVFGGGVGTGKSHLAIGILQAVMPAYTGLYTTCQELIQAVRSTWQRSSERTEAQVLKAFAAVDLLVLDEVGVQMGTDNEQQIVFSVLDKRYRDMRPTIILTNQNGQGLQKYLGDRAFDRLKETSKFVHFGWTSYRKTAAKVVA